MPGKKLWTARCRSLINVCDTPIILNPDRLAKGIYSYSHRSYLVSRAQYTTDRGKKKTLRSDIGETPQKTKRKKYLSRCRRSKHNLFHHHIKKHEEEKKTQTNRISISSSVCNGRAWANDQCREIDHPGVLHQNPSMPS